MPVPSRREVLCRQERRDFVSFIKGKLCLPYTVLAEYHLQILLKHLFTDASQTLTS